MLSKIFAKIDDGQELLPADMRALLSIENRDELEELLDRAYAVKTEEVGRKVFFRGIVEFSNRCEKDCFYCGIRRSNTHATRFQMSHEEIVRAALWAYDNGYGSIVLQSGERTGSAFVDFVDGVLKAIKQGSKGELGITLSLGEQSRDTYARWFESGAHRYLLRIETTNPELYGRLHPEDHSQSERMACLDRLRDVGYQVGTGVMIGLPWQTIDDLVNDLIFFREQDIDMIGMGPYIVHAETPLANSMPDFDAERQLMLGLKMIAVARLYLRDVNIAATTALQALDPQGREKGLQAGANIIMPNITDTKYRAAYQLYENKPCLDENSTMCRACLSRRITGIDETIGYNEWGDSPHFAKRVLKKL